MKTTFYIFVLLFGVWTCSGKPEPNLELSNPEAFAFDLGDSWEINASVTTMGFQQNQGDDNFNIKLSYSVDLITASSDTMLSVYNDVIEENFNEEITDYILEAQIEVDSSFSEGAYRLIFNVKDELSNQDKSIEVSLNLTK